MIRALIFDMDGVISDTQTIYSEVESGVLARYGVAISPEEITTRYSGVSYSRMLPELFGDSGTALNLETVINELHGAVDARLFYGDILPIGGAVELVGTLYNHNFRLAVASGSRRGFIDYVLSKLDLKGKFQAVASGYDVKRGKPEPDVFLLAAERLGVAPEECVVIEDGINGMIGAKKAGMKCIGLVEDKTGEYPADVLVTSLSEITTELIKSLLHDRTEI